MKKLAELILKEARISSEIESVITTHDRLYLVITTGIRLPDKALHYKISL